MHGTRNPWECDFCGQTSPSMGVKLCPACTVIEHEAGGDLGVDAMYAASIRWFYRLTAARYNAQRPITTDDLFA